MTNNNSLLSHDVDSHYQRFNVMMDNVRNEIHIKRYPAKTLRIVMYDVKFLRW